MFSTGNIIKTMIYPSVAAMCVYLNMEQEILNILWILIVIDFITGVIKAYRVWEKITSKHMWIWLVSKWLLLLVPIIVWLWLKAIDWDTTRLMSGMISILVVAEAYSSIANIMQAMKWEKIEEFDVITLILTKILNKFRKILDNLLK